MGVCRLHSGHLDELLLSLLDHVQVLRLHRTTKFLSRHSKFHRWQHICHCANTQWSRCMASGCEDYISLIRSSWHRRCHVCIDCAYHPDGVSSNIRCIFSHCIEHAHSIGQRCLSHLTTFIQTKNNEFINDIKIFCYEPN